MVELPDHFEESDLMVQRVKEFYKNSRSVFLRRIARRAKMPFLVGQRGNDR